MPAPLWAGAVQDTFRLLFHTFTVGALGAAGTLAGVAVAESDHALSPERFVAATRT